MSEPTGDNVVALSAEQKTAHAKIHRAAKKSGTDVRAEADDGPTVVQAMSIMAMSLDMPEVDDHPNRMPFTGVLTRLDVVSNNAPHGTGGKKIILTSAAAEQALPSLLGMGVDLKQDLTGHNAQNKVGIITSASIDGDAINIGGFIYCADFPREALRIQLNKADLGFSFEASNLSVASMKDNPLTITRLSFTGAAILLKNEAAYTNTALAAAKAKEHEMEEVDQAVAKALPDAVAKAMEPITKALADIAAAQSAQAVAIEEIKKTPALALVEANAAMCARVEPHAAGLEAAASAMEGEGIGVAPTAGHTHHLRRMAGAMRGDAARGKLPDSYHDSGSYYAGADQSRQQQPQHTEDDDVKVQDAPEFKELKASADKTASDLKESQDALKKAMEQMASMDTRLTDMKASMDAARPAPERKTIPPAIAAILARNGLTEAGAEANGGAIPIGKIDAALAGLDTSERVRIKTNLGRAGVIDYNNGNGNGAR